VNPAKRAALGALAASVMALAAPVTAAHADSGDTLKGGCGFNTDENAVATNGQNEGVIYVAALSQDASPPAPSGATISCVISVNGVTQEATRLTTHGTGAVVGAQQISFSAVDGDQINECQTVTFDDGSTWTAADGNVGTDCPPATTIVFPPPVVQGLIDTVIATVNSVLALTDAINPIICPIFASVGPQNIAGIVTIAADGSLVIADPLGLIVITNDCSTV